MPYQTIEVKKLTPHIGAEIGGVDLSRPLGNQQFQEVHDALMENLVIFFRDQQLTHDQHKAFRPPVRRVCAIHPASPHAPEGHPEILTIHADENSKHVAGEEWHSDVSCDPEPADGQHPLPDRDAAGRRRHAVRQHVCRLRKAVAADAAALSRA